MASASEEGIAAELQDVFWVTQVTRGTPLESIVGADLVETQPGAVSRAHRHNRAHTVLWILSGDGVVKVGDEEVAARPGLRIQIGVGVAHLVRAGPRGLAFLSVQSPPILNKATGELDLETV
jgi:quercetin dioxygenase-like cupin family protein